jgi:asparagine synthase (glutamine-hydrolysing)
VPVGSFNSGGVDSSLVTAMMRSLTEGELHTFSVGFDEPLYDERRFAKIVADKLGTSHHTLVINQEQYAASLPQVVAQLEEPVNHPHTVQFLHLSRYAKEYVTVVLTGEGSDELFGGYPRYQIPLLARYLRFMPEILSKGLLDLVQRAGQRRLVKLLENAAHPREAVIENSRYTSLQDLELLFPANHRFQDRESAYEQAALRNGTPLRQLLHFDQHTYLPGLLARLDKMSMAGSLECRVPFLDYRMVEWSAALPDRYKIKLGRMNKVIVKKVAERWLPREIVYREKVGFGVPLAEWFRNPHGLGRYLDVLTDKSFRERGFFDAKSVDRLVGEHLHEGLDHHEILWGLVNLELWCRTFIDAGVSQ